VTDGDPAAAAAAARAISARLGRLATEMEAAAGGWPGAAPGWHGLAADAVAHLLAIRPARFRAVATACAAAAGALSRHADALAPAVALQRQAEQAPVIPAARLDRRAADLAAESARQTAGVLMALAASAAPAHRPWLERADDWRGEIQLGAAESTEALISTLGQVAVRMLNPFDRRTPGEARHLKTTVEAATQHPLDVVKSMLDWDTWRTNPARAAGHLVPDLVGAVASGGTAATARAVTVTGRTRAAVQAAAARDQLRREAQGAVATASREALVRRALQAPARTEAWLGPGGSRLTPRQNAGAEAFRTLSVADEPSVTAAMQAAVTAGRGRLAGLDQRLKPSDSYKRKLAEAHSTGRPLPDLLARVKDAVRYTAVLDDANYVRGVADIAAALEQRGFHAQSTHNAWFGPRYRGINSHWLDPVTGAAFEVQFHTPASWRITKQTHDWYEEFRLPTTPAVRQAELHELIAAQYRQAPIPGWVQTLTKDTFLPSTRPDPIVAPVDYTGLAAVLGSAVSGAGTVAPRVTEAGHGQDPGEPGGHSRTP
jgi:hypothetical protein